MNFKKTMLKSAVAVALGSLATGAFAVPALTGSTGTGAFGYDVETVNANSVYGYTLVATPTAGKLTADADLLGDGNGFQVRFTLSSGTFAAPVDPAFVDKGTCTNVTSTTILKGGAKGDNFVVFRAVGNNTAPACAKTEYLNLQYVTKAFTVQSPTALATVGGQLKMTVELFDNSGTGLLFPAYTVNLTGLSVAGSTFTTAANGNPTVADVTFGNTKFVGGGSTAKLGTVSWAVSPGKALDTNADFAFASGDRLTVAVSGDFSACAATNCVFYDTDASGTFTAGDVAFTVSGGTATGSIPLSTTASGKNIVYATNGTSIITAPANYTVSATASYGNAGYTAGAATGGPAFGSITSNGVSAVVSFLNPAAEEAASGYVSILRCTNSDSVDADAYFTLYQDDGTKSTNTKIGTIKAGGSQLWFSSKLEELSKVTLIAGQKGRGIVNLNARKGFCMVWNMNTANKTLTSQGPVATGSGPTQ